MKMNVRIVKVNLIYTVAFKKMKTKGEYMESDIIKISHLNKSFGEVKAVNDLSFRVKKGELFAFLGVNGAGKSTTISILCGLLKKDSGTVQVNGIETDKAGTQTKRMLSVVFQDSVLDKPLTVKENLMSRAALYGITGKAFDKRLQELVEILDFDEFLNRPVGKLSGGQRRRIDIARALLHRPEILILDEPTTGLDPQTRQLIWNVIEKLQKTENMTVFLTTHYMEEAANAGYVVILDKGSIAAQGTPFELKNDYVQDIVSVYGVSEDEIKTLNREYGMTILVSSHILEELYQTATEFILIDNGKIIEKISAQELDERCKRHIAIQTLDTKQALIVLSEQLCTDNYKVMPDGTIRLYDYLDNIEQVARVFSDAHILVTGLTLSGDTLEDYFLSRVGGFKNGKSSES